MSIVGSEHSAHPVLVPSSQQVWLNKLTFFPFWCHFISINTQSHNLCWQGNCSHSGGFACFKMTAYASRQTLELCGAIGCLLWNEQLVLGAWEVWDQIVVVAFWQLWCHFPVKNSLCCKSGRCQLSTWDAISHSSQHYAEEITWYLYCSAMGIPDKPLFLFWCIKKKLHIWQHS